VRRVLNYGGGVNSTALLVESVRRGCAPVECVFADTGSEHPDSIAYLEHAKRYCDDEGIEFTVLRWIREDGSFVPLHEWCEKMQSLPSKAFGMAGCTSKWKQQPIDKYLANKYDGERIERMIGFDAGEISRVANMQGRDTERWKWTAPLFDWGMDRYGCLVAIDASGLPRPRKSACWLCPSMKKNEVRELRRDHPDLYKKAANIEKNAIESGNLISVRGLGRTFAWSDLSGVECNDVQHCLCFDGDDGS